MLASTATAKVRPGDTFSQTLDSKLVADSCDWSGIGNQGGCDSRPARSENATTPVWIPDQGGRDS